MKQVFRLEHPETGYQGAYTGPGIPFLYRNSEPSRHPAPWEDSALKEFWQGASELERRRYKFGFGSFAQFRAWFYADEVIVAAYRVGYVVNVYNVPDVAVQHGNAQVVFHDTYHTPADIIYTLSVVEGLTSAREFDYTDIVLKSTTNLNWKTP